MRYLVCALFEEVGVEESPPRSGGFIRGFPSNKKPTRQGCPKGGVGRSPIPTHYLPIAGSTKPNSAKAANLSKQESQVPQGTSSPE